MNNSKLLRDAILKIKENAKKEKNLKLSYLQEKIEADQAYIEGDFKTALKFYLQYKEKAYDECGRVSDEHANAIF